MLFGFCDPVHPSLGYTIGVWVVVGLIVALYLGAVVWLVYTGRGARWRVAAAFALGVLVPTVVLWRDPPSIDEHYSEALVAAAIVVVVAAVLAWRQSVRGFVVATLGAGGALLLPIGALVLALSLGWGCID